MKWLIIAALVALSACSQPLRQNICLERPVRPTLPRFSADDAQPLSGSAYQRLVARDVMRRQYAERLESIIDSTCEPR